MPLGLRDERKWQGIGLELREIMVLCEQEAVKIRLAEISQITLKSAPILPHSHHHWSLSSLRSGLTARSW